MPKIINDPELVIVRGISDEWIKENYGQLLIYFGGDHAATLPKEDSNYVALYSSSPVSKITHIGIVEDIHRYPNGVAEFYLKCLIVLKKPIDPGHGIRKHEYWKLSHFGLTSKLMESIYKSMSTI